MVPDRVSRWLGLGSAGSHEALLISLRFVLRVFRVRPCQAIVRDALSLFLELLTCGRSFACVICLFAC